MFVFCSIMCKQSYTVINWHSYDRNKCNFNYSFNPMCTKLATVLIIVQTSNNFAYLRITNIYLTKHNSIICPYINEHAVFLIGLKLKMIHNTHCMQLMLFTVLSNHTHTHTHHTHTHTHTHTHSLSTHTPHTTLSLSLSLTHTHYLSLSLSHTHTHSLSLSL